MLIAGSWLCNAMNRWAISLCSICTILGQICWLWVRPVALVRQGWSRPSLAPPASTVSATPHALLALSSNPTPRTQHRCHRWTVWTISCSITIRYTSFHLFIPSEMEHAEIKQKGYSYQIQRSAEGKIKEVGWLRGCEGGKHDFLQNHSRVLRNIY